MSTNNTILATDKIIQQLEATKNEVEHFIYELNLEKTDPESRYEKLKEELRESVREMRELLDQGVIAGEVAAALLAKLSAIDEHMMKPERNAVDHVKLFLRAIRSTLQIVKNAIGKGGVVNEHLERIHDQLQRYRLKFEILKLKFALGKLKMMYTSKDLQYQLTQKIHALSEFIRDNKQGASDTLKKLRHMTGKIYSDISKIYT